MDRTVDWRGVDPLPEFRELQHERRRFVAPATVFFLGRYCGSYLLALRSS